MCLKHRVWNGSPVGPEGKLDPKRFLRQDSVRILL